MNYELLDRSWYKRRDPVASNRVVTDVQLVDFKKEHNHFCDMYVDYSDGTSKKYIARVVWNELKEYWTVDGMHEAIRIT